MQGADTFNAAIETFVQATKLTRNAT